jgi:hypothetical protein
MEVQDRLWLKPKLAVPSSSSLLSRFKVKILPCEQLSTAGSQCQRNNHTIIGLKHRAARHFCLSGGKRGSVFVRNRERLDAGLKDGIEG